MRNLVHTVFLVGVVSAFLLPGNAAAVGNRFFIGLWQGIDTLDGSEMLVSINDNDRDGILEVRLTETFFATCIAQNKGFSGSPGILEGTGTVNGKILTWNFSFKCYDPATNSLTEILTGPSTYEAHRRDNILVDEEGNIFHRIGKR